MFIYFKIKQIPSIENKILLNTIASRGGTTKYPIEIKTIKNSILKNKTIKV